MTVQGIEDALTRKYGPLPGYAWAAIGAGAIVLIARRGSSTNASTAAPAYLTLPPQSGVSADELGAGGGGGGGGSDGTSSGFVDPAISTGLPSTASQSPSVTSPAPAVIADPTFSTDASSTAPTLAPAMLLDTSPTSTTSTSTRTYRDTNPPIVAPTPVYRDTNPPIVAPHNPNDTVLGVVGTRAVVQETTGNAGEIAKGTVIGVPTFVNVTNTGPAITTDPHPAALALAAAYNAAHPPQHHLAPAQPLAGSNPTGAIAIPTGRGGRVLLD